MKLTAHGMQIEGYAWAKSGSWTANRSVSGAETDTATLEVFRVDADGKEPNAVHHVAMKMRPKFKLRVMVWDGPAEARAAGLMRAWAETVPCEVNAAKALAQGTTTQTGEVTIGPVTIPWLWFVIGGQGLDSAADTDENGAFTDSETVNFRGTVTASAFTAHEDDYVVGMVDCYAECEANIYDSVPGFEITCGSSDGAYLQIHYGWNG